MPSAWKLLISLSAERADGLEHEGHEEHEGSNWFENKKTV
jgi:hypothetical protein